MKGGYKKAPAFRTSEILRREQGYRFVYYYRPFSSKAKGIFCKNSLYNTPQIEFAVEMACEGVRIVLKMRQLFTEKNLYTLRLKIRTA